MTAAAPAPSGRWHEIRRSLATICDNDQVFEIRAMGRDGAIYSGYLLDIDEAARQVEILDTADVSGIYVTLNPVAPALTARRSRVVKIRGDATTSDADTTRRRWLPIDLDPVRPSGISSNDVEKAAAHKKAQEIITFLDDHGWPGAVVGDSGNGYHVLYRVDLPNDEAARELVKGCLEVLAARFSDAAVSVDTKNFNAARIWKVYGTTARKGEDTQGRPHRRARILSKPDPIKVVSRVLLEGLVIEGNPRPQPAPTRTSGGNGSGDFDLAAWLDKYGHNLPCKVIPKTKTGQRSFYLLDPCPFCNGAHQDGAFLGQAAGGAVYAKCHHNSCGNENRWRELRAMGQPGYTVRSKPQKPARAFEIRNEQPGLCKEDDDIDLICLEYPLTEMGNAARLVARYGCDLKYCHPWRKWLVWDGTRWKPDDTGKIMRLAKDTAMRIGDEAHAAGGSSDLYKWAGTSQSHSRINAMVALTQSEVPVLPADLDADPNLLNFPNGTLELDTFTFREHKREDRCTKAMGCEYLPDAICPLWVQFLDTIFDKNDNLIKFVQRGLGYSLTADIGERAIFLCHGSGANGKSTLLNTVASAMGEYARQTESNTFCQQKHDGVRNDIAALKGARYVIAIESKKGKRLDEALVKQLSGGDTVAARFLFQEYFEFKPEFKIWWAFNHKPRIDDTTQSVWDRVKLIPFNVVIPLEERDKDFPAKLVKELPGIVAWMVEGLREYRNIGLAEPAEVTVATQEYQAEQDRLGDWRAERTVEDPAAWTSSRDLYVDYQDWCNENREAPISPRSFGFDMGDRYPRKQDKVTRKKGYCGIRLGKNPTLSNTPESGKAPMSTHRIPNSESPYEKQLCKECENRIHGSSWVQTPDLKSLQFLIAEYDLPRDLDISQHIKFTKTGQYCTCKGCGKPAEWHSPDKVRPLPLCDHHYQKLKNSQSLAGGER